MGIQDFRGPDLGLRFKGLGFSLKVYGFRDWGFEFRSGWPPRTKGNALGSLHIAVVAGKA